MDWNKRTVRIDLYSWLYVGENGQMIYKVWVRLEAEYDDIEAEDEIEAFQIASEQAVEDGDGWSYKIERSEE